MDNIKHFVLPEHTNTLYQKEAISSISLTRDIADKINELVDAYNTLSKLDLGWKQEQEGTIRKGVLFMKDNLLNSLNDLMNLLLASGYIDERIKTQINTLHKRVENLLTSKICDGEVVDIRTRANKLVYNLAGNALRAIDEDLIKLNNEVFTKIIPYNVPFKECGYIHSNGYIVNDENSYRTGRIYCKNYDFLRYKTNMGAGGLQLVFYDATGEIIPDLCVEGESNFTEHKIRITETNAEYLEVCCYGSDNVINAICELSTISYLEKSLTNYDKKLFPFTATFNENGYIHPDGYVASGDAKRTGKINCEGYDFVKYSSNLSKDGYELTLYDALGNCLHDFCKVGVGSFKENIVDISNTGAVYLEVSCYGSDYYNLATCTLFNKTNVKMPPTAFKKMLVFGDSITETATMNNDGTNYVDDVYTNWLTYAKDILKITDIHNYACSGAHYADFNTTIARQKLSTQLAIAFNKVSEPNIVVLSLGTNDTNQTTVDSYNEAMSKTSLESLDKTKLYQSIRFAMESIKEHYPYATCFAATPIHRSDREPDAVVRNAIIEMAERYNFIVIHAEKESGITKENADLYLIDGLHPNNEGKKKIATCYCNTIINHFISDFYNV